ncbi:MAG TPA: polymorphic toxin type 44 domain-containing protein [Polyangiaceae bacterium]|nr:polymorphic toxin type 44 domain-containing protein [Polyangiaceae bacterium]
MVDELTPVANYMTSEMNTNSAGADCKRMKELNSTSSEQCIEGYLRSSWWQRWVGMQPDQCVQLELTSKGAAVLAWTGNVMQKADWDHKPKLFKLFYSPTTNSHVWMVYGKDAYYYDIWSNIHYGYVGTAAGFSENILLDGAGLEQLGSDVLRGRFPRGTAGVTGLRRFDDAGDRNEIALGIMLFGLYPRGVSSRVLLQHVVTAPGLSKEAAARHLAPGKVL